MVDKNKAVVCCLLATSAIMLSEKKIRKRKKWSKKWCLKRNISCDTHLLNELLETDVHWDDAIVVSAGKLRNCGIPWVNCTVLCVKGDWKGQFWGLRYCMPKLRSLLSFFPSGVKSHNKIAQFNCECIGRFTVTDLCHADFKSQRSRWWLKLFSLWMPMYASGQHGTVHFGSESVYLTGSGRPVWPTNVCRGFIRNKVNRLAFRC
jgi:hypothetical protein